MWLILSNCLLDALKNVTSDDARAAHSHAFKGFIYPLFLTPNVSVRHKVTVLRHTAICWPSAVLPHHHYAATERSHNLPTPPPPAVTLTPPPPQKEAADINLRWQYLKTNRLELYIEYYWEARRSFGQSRRTAKQISQSIWLAHLLLNAVQQRPVGLVGGGEGHHGQQLGLLADDALLGGKPTSEKQFIV